MKTGHAPAVPRGTLASITPSGDGRPDEARSEEARRTLWIEHGIPAFRLGSTRALAWQIIEAEANRQYGKRGNRGYD